MENSEEARMVALRKMNNVWIRNDKIKQTTSARLKLYRTLVKPILMYYSGQKGEEDLDAFHRKQLRLVLNMKYPVKMRSRSVYKMTLEEKKKCWSIYWGIVGNCSDMSSECTKEHQLSNQSCITSRTAKLLSFVADHESTCPGSSTKIWRKVLCRQYAIELKLLEDLQRLTVVALDRMQWKNLVERMCGCC